MNRRYYCSEQTTKRAVALSSFLSCLPSSRKPETSCIFICILYEKKLFTRGYGEKNILITGTSAARRPKVGGGGGGAPISKIRRRKQIIGGGGAIGAGF